MRKHTAAVFGQARVTPRHVPRNTCCRHKPALPLHDYKTVSNGSAYTPEHMEIQLHPHFDTCVDPSCSLHKATNHILYWIGTAKMMVPKSQECGNTGSHYLDRPVFGPEDRRGGGDTMKGTTVTGAGCVKTNAPSPCKRKGPGTWSTPHGQWTAVSRATAVLKTSLRGCPGACGRMTPKSAVCSLFSGTTS